MLENRRLAVVTDHVDVRSGSSRSGKAETIAQAWGDRYRLVEAMFLDGERSLMTLRVADEAAHIHLGATGYGPDEQARALAVIAEQAAEIQAELCRQRWITVG
jgi:hypothetical protein